MNTNYRFQISSKKSFTSLVNLFFSSVLLLLISIIIFKYWPAGYVKPFFFFGFLILFIISARFFWLQFTFLFKKKKFKITNRGLSDYLSFLALGFVNKQDIQTITLKRFWKWNYLQIQLIPNSVKQKRMKEPKKLFWELYQILFNTKIYIPLNLFHCKSEDLALVFHSSDYDTEIDPTALSYNSGNKSPLQTEKPLKNPSSSLSEKTRPRQKVLSVSTEQKEMGKRLLQLYEVISRKSFAKFLDSPPFSTQISDYSLKSQGGNRAVELIFEGSHLKLNFEIIKKDDNLARMILYCDGALVFNSKVEIEIGDYTLETILHFHEGDWSKKVQNLQNLIKNSIKWDTKFKVKSL